MAGAVDTLFLPILNGEVAPQTGRWLYLGAQVPAKGFMDVPKNRLVCEQPLRGPFLDLEKQGLELHPYLKSEEVFEGALILIGKHRAENESMIARATRHCPENAVLVIAGDKKSGVASLRKRVAQLTEIKGSLAKYHATVFWLRNANQLSQLKPTQVTTNPNGYHTAPGMFSYEKVDRGSELLAGFIDISIKGKVADFGAGWGYLSKVILEKSAATSLDLFEAHWPSLEAAKLSLQNSKKVPIAFHWVDLIREPLNNKFDCIVMNPPFHIGRRTEPGLGEGFIKAAATCLRPKGVLLMVANTGLPYEKTLAKYFSKAQLLEKREGFKVFRAIK